MRYEGWSRRVEPEELPEWMDAPCSYEEFRACLRDLEQVNRLTFGYRPTLRFLNEVVKRRGKSGAPLRVLDVGCGGGDALRRIAKWAKARKVQVELTGIDLNPFAARAARERGGDGPINYITGDAFSCERPLDVVVSSLFTHHLPSPELVRFLTWMENSSQLGWCINDLERSAFWRGLFQALANAARWHPLVRHDGPVSFRRSFRHEDWERLLVQAGIALRDVSIVRALPGRLCVYRWK